MIQGLLACFFFLPVNIISFSMMVNAQGQLPSNGRAGKETVSLYQNLHKLAQKGFMFGHQDDLAYGVGWKYELGRSDVKEVTGDYPAVYGWELGGLERVNSEVNLDSVPFEKMKQFIREAYARGGVNTISWHADSPFGAKAGAWDTTSGTVAAILPGGSHHELYKTWLDKLAGFLADLKGSQGEAIPILFRPFHEHTGNWFWWGKSACTADEYKLLWKFTVEYLQDEKKLNNLLWVYNTSGNFNTEKVFMMRYPGDELVDMLSFDTYQYGDPDNNGEFIVQTNIKLKILGIIAAKRNKLFSLGETGYEAIPDAEWWTNVLLKIIGSNKISYVLLWRNHGYHQDMKKMHYYVPYKGHTSEKDFRKFYRLKQTLFEKEVMAEKLYQ